MKKHLQALFRNTFFIAIASIGILSFTQAQELTTTIWERTSGIISVGVDSTVPHWLTAGSVRGIAYGTVDGNTRVYAADRANTTIRVMDAETGEDVTPTTPFDLSGVSGGTFAMNDIEVSDDGVIFLGNLTTDLSASPFRIYWWTQEGGAYADSLTISGAGGRLGDKFTVVGSVADNTVEIWMTDAGSDPGIVYVATTSDNGANWNVETINLTGSNVSIPANASVSPFSVGRTSDFYIAGNGSSPKRYTSAGAYVEGSVFSSIDYTGSRNGLRAFEVEGMQHLSVYSYRPDGNDAANSTGMAYIYNVQDPTAPITVSVTPLLGEDVATFSSIHGEAIPNIISADSIDLFILDGVNGIGAFAYRAPLPEPLAGTYYIPKGANDMGFDSLAAAIDYINTYGLSAQTTLLIDGDLTENTQLRISRDDLSANNNLIIKPAAGKQVTIHTDDLRLVDTGYITIDGSNNGTTSKDLTIQKSGTSGGVLSLLSNTTNVNIKNLNITYADDNGLTTYAVLINRREGSVETGKAENVTFDNVSIGTSDKPYRDAFWLFGSASNPEFWHVNVSLINGEAHVGRSFLRSQTHTNTVISGNVISSYGSETGTNPVINLNTPIETFTLTGNEILFADAAGTEDRTYIGVNATNSLVEEVLIANNTFSNSGFAGTGTGNGFIAFSHDGGSSSANFKFVHNSINLEDNLQTGTHAAIRKTVDASAAATVESFNNIFVNKNGGGDSFIYKWTGNSLSANYNNITTSLNGSIALYDDFDYSTLTAFKDSTGLDAATTTKPVSFVSGTDLRLTGESIGDDDLAGIPFAEVSTDIDGNVRSTVAPYKGAFEGNIELSSETMISSFDLLLPVNDTNIDLGQDVAIELSFSWEEATSNEAVTYLLVADSVDADFSTPVLSVSSDVEGTATLFTTSYLSMDSVLADFGVLEGESINLKWSVIAMAGDSSRYAESSFLISFTRRIIVSNEPEDAPLSFKLEQNYPNPFNPSSTIEFTLPQTENVRLDVFSINGQLVTTLVNKRLNAGEHSVIFNARNLASGVYIYRIMAGSFVQTKRMTLIK